MDAFDILDIQEAMEEFYDQTCTIYRAGTPVGAFPCLVLPMGAAGGVTGMSPDPVDAAAAGLGTWRIHLPIESESAVQSGSRIVASRGPLDLAIVGADFGRSVPAFTTVSAAKQEIATTPINLVLKRWNASTKVWDSIPAQEFQALVRGLTESGEPPFGFVRKTATVTLVGPLDRNIVEGDQFAWEGGAGEIDTVFHSDRIEAVGTVRW